MNRLVKKGKVLAAYTPGYGGVAEGILKMSLGNGIGLAFDPAAPWTSSSPILRLPSSWS